MAAEWRVRAVDHRPAAALGNTMVGWLAEASRQAGRPAQVAVDTAVQGQAAGMAEQKRNNQAAAQGQQARPEEHARNADRTGRWGGCCVDIGDIAWEFSPWKITEIATSETWDCHGPA